MANVQRTLSLILLIFLIVFHLFINLRASFVVNTHVSVTKKVPAKTSGGGVRRESSQEHAANSSKASLDPKSKVDDKAVFSAQSYKQARENSLVVYL